MERSGTPFPDILALRCADEFHSDLALFDDDLLAPIGRRTISIGLFWSLHNLDFGFHLALRACGRHILGRSGQVPDGCLGSECDPGADIPTT